MKNKVSIFLIIILFAALGFIVWQNFLSSSSEGVVSEGENTEQQAGKQLYTCGMHPEIISDEPGNCPICGMKLTPIKDDGEDSGTAEGIVKIDPVIQQNMNLKTIPIERRDFSASVLTNGIFAVDERLENIITSKVSGWVEELYVNYTGKQVSKGQKLLSLYSPELVAAQQELLSAVNYKVSVASSSNELLRDGGNELVENAKRKLELLEMSEADIEKILNGGDVQKYITLYAQVSGTVMEKAVTQGEKIRAGVPLMRIANLNRLWLMADIYESEFSKISVGDEAIIIVQALPGEIFKGKVSFIYPTIDNATRTAKVRIDIDNRMGLLKPDMLARVEIKGTDYGFAPAIPENAVIRTGKINIAIQSLGEGKFKPVAVQLGEYSDEGFYQLLGGLSEGDVVVTSAQFLIDSESNLKTAVDMYSGAGGNHGSHGMQDSENTDSEDSESESPLVRTGTIDVESIDHNHDGHLYECPMDWNVLSDEPGRCPLCEMKLKKYSIDEIKKNLDEHGHAYKKSRDSDDTIRDREQQKKVNEQQHHTDKIDETRSNEPENEYGIESTLIRTGVIDIESLDQNKDGKLFECPMDWNIIGDDPGRCPVCEMKLKEYSLADIKKNLEKHGYAYKESGHEGHSHDEHLETNTQEEPENEYGIESPLIRTGVIEVESLDQNKDGKLFECPMDWNIIGDDPGRCPACGMKLKEYSLTDIKKNLEKYGYEYQK